MPMNMHMIGVMYAPTDKLTLMAMLPVVDTYMVHATRSGGAFRTESRGVGDVSVNALYKLGDFGAQRTHLNLGVRLPSGSIEKQDVTPVSAPAETRLPYPMQLGSGTFDITPGLTYLTQAENWSGGAQVRATIALTLAARVLADDVLLGEICEYEQWFDRTSVVVRGNASA